MTDHGLQAKNEYMKKIILIAVSLLVFLGFSLYSYSEICCMFGATRYYGWPYSYISLSKSVETYEEAKRVKQDSALELKKDGWQWRFDVRMSQKSILGSSVISLMTNLGLSFIIALAAFGAYDKLKSGKK